MITSLQLAASGVAKFNAWFGAVAREGVRAEAVAVEVCDQMIDRLSQRETLMYELGPRYTISGRPEHLYLERADLEVEEDEELTWAEEDAEAIRLGFWAKRVPGRGWVECGADDAGAMPDINRLRAHKAGV